MLHLQAELLDGCEDGSCDDLKALKVLGDFYNKKEESFLQLKASAQDTRRKLFILDLNNIDPTQHQ